MIISSGPFKGLRKNYYKVILADPAWTFKTRSDKGKSRSPEKHYHCMKMEDIMALPIRDLAAPDCVLLMWITDPLIFQSDAILRNFGFTPKTVGFYWVKLNKDDTPFTGMGFWTRANPEQCHLATIGKPKRTGKGVKRLIMSPRREHSRKPDEIFDRIEQLVDGPYLELFSRETREGWDTWGNEVGKFNIQARPRIDYSYLI